MAAGDGGWSISRMTKPLTVCLIAILLVGCAFSSQGIRLLDENNCVPPCWQGIVPGETTRQELLDILSKSSIVDHTTLRSVRQPDSIFSDVIYANLYPDESASTNLLADLLEDHIADLLFEAGGGWNLTGEGAIGQLGKPKTIIIFQSTGDVFVTMVNPETGLAFGYCTVGRSRRARLEIGPADKISFLIFFDPRAYEVLKKTGIFSWHLLDEEEIQARTFPWKGLGRIEELYP